MKDIDELEEMTLFDITSNEGALTLIILGSSMILLAIGSIFINIFYKIKYAFK